jgi:hypothetical protein
MADKKSKAEDTPTEDVVYMPEAVATAAPTNDPTKLNTLAVVSLASAATGFGAVAGIITGHVALAQLRRSGEKGHGLAIAGLITGYVGIAGFALMSALAIGGHWGENRMDGPRGYMSHNQIDPQENGQFGGMMRGHFGGRDQGQGQGQGGPTIMLPNGQTVTTPNSESNGDSGMMGDPGMMGVPGFTDTPPQPTPMPSGVQGN